MEMKWVRAQDGAVLGVCKGLARSLDISVGVFRLLWLISVLFLGAGFWLYILLAISLPREDKTIQALDSKLLGVCAKIAVRTQLEIGIVRFLTICLSLISFGATIVGYVVLYFVLDNPRTQSSDSNPSSPRFTT